MFYYMCLAPAFGDGGGGESVVAVCHVQY